MDKPIEASPVPQAPPPQPVKPKVDHDLDFVTYSEKHTEKVLFVIRPSMMRFALTVFFCVITFWLIFPLLALIYIYYQNKSTKYIVTNERIRIISGMLVRHIVDLELFRVKDIAITVPFYLQLCNLGTVELTTSDPSNPYLHLEAIKDPHQVEECIRYNVEKRRDEKKVQEIDQYRYERK